MSRNFLFVKPYRLLGAIVFLYCFQKTISADTVLLKDGRRLENVKTVLKEDHVLAEDEFGKTEKIDPTQIEKITLGEIKKKPVVPENEKKFRVSAWGTAWNAGVHEDPNLQRVYSTSEILQMTMYVDPYVQRDYRVKVRTIAFQIDYKKDARNGFSLALEQSTFSFPARGVNPLTALWINMNTIGNQTYAELTLPATLALLTNPSWDEYDVSREQNEKFSLKTLSLSPSYQYYYPITESIRWFSQIGFGIGRSYQSGIYAKAVLQDAAFLGTGFQIELDPYFFRITFQYRATTLHAGPDTYRFTEPQVSAGLGIGL
ncbi:hypothetical protein EHQ12_04915 [Leptospira gomenensis]|uniref:Uncharacterized protein n=1 Tax=Leptospira gomenensis TaxID=2484974 RepID=A0A5F1YHE2_9LEPT|nr:hypothetical protein [Leptospira gomenensis]TGK39240.1 hypothetical protein EHQ17_00290 [Leptospira gomenensis]TGK42546.1 hypothetical protein EHQ12_04915 [Leptospira gomenensis]TGK48910.1 hypothetical protein EHQ07_05040 [Leptospira gomenensis]TGK54620.1 hypothetical protein EHQ13_19010 [Leptospira gomenensis]